MPLLLVATGAMVCALDHLRDVAVCASAGDEKGGKEEDEKGGGGVGWG